MGPPGPSRSFQLLGPLLTPPPTGRICRLSGRSRPLGRLGPPTSSETEGPGLLLSLMLLLLLAPFSLLLLLAPCSLLLRSRQRPLGSDWPT